jgi:hypothetical protein
VGTECDDGTAVAGAGDVQDKTEIGENRYEVVTANLHFIELLWLFMLEITFLY